MTIELVPHPTSRATIEKVEMLIWRDEATFDLDVRLFGSPLRVRLPTTDRPQRRDELWKTTCFEAFLRPRGSESYFELNMSPSGDWAAYHFDSYRTGRREALIDCVPDLEVWLKDGIRMQDGRFDFSREPALDRAVPWDIGLSAVIEEIDGSKSYWALAHGKGPPDFHSPTCFAYHLAPFEPE